MSLHDNFYWRKGVFQLEMRLEMSLVGSSSRVGDAKG
jgi:hypothetical protein